MPFIDNFNINLDIFHILVNEINLNSEAKFICLTLKKVFFKCY